jgi:sugar lactone lactonase YvrE
MGVPPERWPAELVLDARALLGEGPVWDEATGVLYWVDIDRCAIHRFDPVSGEDDAVDTGEPVGSVALRSGGGLVAACKSGFALLDGWGSPLQPFVAVEADRDETRMNDGACDSRGRFWAGTMHAGLEPCHGSLYRLDPDATVTRMLGDVSISNGVGWSPDETTMYYVDTPTGGIDAFDFDADAGTIGRRRRLVTIDPADGSPDGLVVDADGCLWVGLWEGWAVRRYAVDGELLGVVDVPAARVTKCAFGGPDLDDVFVTTAAPDEPDPAQPHAGGLFRASIGVRGEPARRFAA